MNLTYLNIMFQTKKKSLKIIMNKTFIHMDIVSLLLTKI